MSQQIIIDKNSVVKKSERLIQARFKLNPIALKLVSSLISTLKETDEPHKEYVFSIKNFGELMGYSSHKLYQLLDEATEELLSKPLKFPTENGKGFRKFNWVSKAEYKYGEGAIVFRIDEDLKPFLFAAKEKYLKYQIHNILKLKSTYSIRLYEIFKDWFNRNERYKKTTKLCKEVELEWLRTTLDIPESYRFNDIKRLFIKAQEQFEQYTDLTFEFNEVKIGKKVNSINFVITDNSRKKLYSSVEEFVSFLKEKIINERIPGTDYFISDTGLLLDPEGIEYSAEEALIIFRELFNQYSGDIKFKEMFI